MTLTDTGPLVALIDAADRSHSWAQAAVDRIQSWPLATTEACLTEALHLIAKAGGWRGVETLWGYIDAEQLIILVPQGDATRRARRYMDRFRDLPCDYADATLLVAAEDYDLREVFTLDSHFHAYRLTSGGALSVLA